MNPLITAVRKFSGAIRQHIEALPKTVPFFGTLFGKLLLPVICFMFLLLLITALVFNIGIKQTTRSIIEGQLQSESQKIITTLQGRLDIVNSSAELLVSNSEIQISLASDTPDSLSTINNRALTIQNRFDLDLIQIYSAKGEARTNLVQSSLYRVSSVLADAPEVGTSLATLDGRLVFLAHKKFFGGGDVFVGIDLLSELSRIAFELGLHDNPTIKIDPNPKSETVSAQDSYTLFTPIQIAGQSLVLTHSQQVSQIETIANSGRNLVILSDILATLVLIILIAFVLHNIVQPIRRLAEISQKLAHADFSSDSLENIALKNDANPFRIGVNDEIGQLSDSFSDMARELQGIYQGLVRELRKTNAELSTAYDSALQGWSSALELRDHDTEKHTERSANALISLAKYIGIPQVQLVHYRRGALLHDVGKMAIPDNILRKKGPLTDEEWQIMRQHPIYAYVMLRKIPFLEDALDIPYCHHEKWDGSGYPRGLFRKQIPLAARIFSVIDVWDSMSYDRPYRKAMPQSEVLDYIASRSGIDFDPDVIKAFFMWLQSEKESSRTK
jgi:putative nucleotidyltransferase with HDIG domain